MVPFVQLWPIIALSLRVAFAAILFSLPLAIACAWILARTQFPGKIIFDGVVHLPLVLPPVVVGYLLLVVFGVHGPVGGWLYHTFNMRLAFTTAGAILATAVMAFPLMVRSMRLSIESIDPGLEAAARTLGARPFDRFLTITLSLMFPGIVSGAMVAFAAALGEFGAVITFAASIPGISQTLPLAIYANLQTPGGEPMVVRLALISIVIALTALVGAELLMRKIHRR